MCTVCSPGPSLCVSRWEMCPDSYRGCSRPSHALMHSHLSSCCTAFRACCNCGTRWEVECFLYCWMCCAFQCRAVPCRAVLCCAVLHRPRLPCQTLCCPIFVWPSLHSALRSHSCPVSCRPALRCAGLTCTCPFFLCFCPCQMQLGGVCSFGQPYLFKPCPVPAR